MCLCFSCIFFLFFIYTVQAYQKDEQVISIFSSKVEKVLSLLKGQLFLNVHQNDILVIVKVIYLYLTTFRNKKTLGEEYTNLLLINRKGDNFVKKYKRIGFILSYLIGPFILKKLKKKIFMSSSNEEEDDDNNQISNNSFTNNLLQNLDRISNLHFILFYFNGAYYEIYRRIWGLRYAYANKVDNNLLKLKKENNRNYLLLGYILSLQATIKCVSSLLSTYNSYIDTNKKKNNMNGYIPENQTIDLSDDKQLPFIPLDSRNCILCLNPMVDPSCAPCGHLYCWKCLLDWCKEKEECPLCRRSCKLQEALPIR